tara:strand:- start:205 stop:684 length:480 start_codon:yes stop_codon:yes gene_type:complete
MKKIIYPGTFDPIHNGHIDIAKKASKLFDHLVFVIAENADKKPFLTANERKELVAQSTTSMKNISIDIHNGLTADYASNNNIVAIIRGLRHVSDFEFEFQMAMMNYHLSPKVTSLFMMPDEKYIHLNSTLIKDVARYGGNISQFVPECVKDLLLSKYNS